MRGRKAEANRPIAVELYPVGDAAYIFAVAEDLTVEFRLTFPLRLLGPAQRRRLVRECKAVCAAVIDYLATGEARSR